MLAATVTTHSHVRPPMHYMKYDGAAAAAAGSTAWSQAGMRQMRDRHVQRVKLGTQQRTAAAAAAAMLGSGSGSLRAPVGVMGPYRHMNRMTAAQLADSRNRMMDAVVAAVAKKYKTPVPVAGSVAYMRLMRFAGLSPPGLW